ncbi:MAG: hypothetical protein JWO10_377 [Microbacteriaceae bacterium]|nr:hypothetical protein [Microbacteriaceae bacterium]
MHASRHTESERGSITAEFATVVPAVLLVLACCLGGMQLAAQQLRLQDAAAVAARSMARGDGAGAATARASQLVPGASIESSDRGDLACVTASSSGRFAGGVLAAIPLTAMSCALGG